MYGLRRFIIAITLIIGSFFALGAVRKHLDPNRGKPTDENAEDARWIATSQHWLDRSACRWIGICGLAHYHPDPAGKYRRAHKKERRDLKVGVDDIVPGPMDQDGRIRPEDFKVDDNMILRDVPQFVLDYAPLVHLYSGEEFWPSDLSEHLKYMIPSINETTLKSKHLKRTVHNLHKLNEGVSGRVLFLKSEDDVEERPDWLGSSWNKPVPFPEEEAEEEVESWLDPYGIDLMTPKSQHKIADPRRIPDVQQHNPQQPELRRAKRGFPEDKTKRPGYSNAPAHLVLLEKPNNITDAFWFYFYSYNLGPAPLNIRFGNHVGDWEHALVRFQNGLPKAIFCSAHSGGLAYAYKAVEKGGKDKKRPVLYSAIGSHAMYATPGRHPYILPFGILADVTDKGPLWDPSLNYKAFWYNTTITHNADARSLPAFPSTNSTGEIPDVSLPTNDTFLPQSVPGVPTKEIPLNTLIPAKDNPEAAISWFHYRGHWGDKFYTLGDWRQWRFVGQYHYVNGPLGPRYKNLGRSKVCQSGGSCTILETLKGRKSWLSK
ncbi:vacuolar protein sorting-associated protein [Phlyctema vagabunda]|uniref:Vacuolar protein sorting-associated protein n=1 Tax=Phlyctema vagabunda TaxID=108571 RepID=A0ABR4PLP3_9HELO